MRRVKKRIFSGAVLEQEVYTIANRAKDPKKAEPKLRFKNEEEREKHKEGIARRRHTRLFNKNFAPTSLYSTLTMDTEHEVHTFREAKRIRDNYIRRLKYKYPDARIVIYLGRGKSTERIHAHMVSEGIPEEDIRALWGMGDVGRIVHLREKNHYNGQDCGQDYSGLANYLFDHWTEEQGGHRYKGTRNLLKPDEEEPREAIREYSEEHPPVAPKGYRLIEVKITRYGYQYFKYIKDEKPKRGRHSARLVNM